MFNSVVISYAELSIKGENKGQFISQLVRNIKSVLDVETETYYGRQIINLNNNSNQDEIKNKLSKVFGIANFSFAVKIENDIEAIKQTAATLLQECKGKIKVSAKRSYKDFPLTSPDINREVGMYVEEKLGLEADYKNPDKICYVDITEKGAFVYTEKHKGLGGLPVGVSGKILMMLSGGIDSPVAAFMLMKRGCAVDFVHFAPQTATSELGESKIKELAKALSKYQPNTKLYWVPFRDLQMNIIPRIPGKDRLLVYRRFMLRIAEALSNKKNYKAVASGESIGQVASQTLENIKAVESAVRVLVLRPLAGLDKQEIIDLAEKIGTYAISIQPYDDCCSFMIPQHPELRASAEELEKLESELDTDYLVKETIKKTKIVSLANGQ